MMQINLNGERRELPEHIHLGGLIDQLSLPRQRIALELNGIVIRRADWPEILINDGDRIEVVHFVGGG